MPLMFLYKFQSLIGRLKTPNPSFPPISSAQFQSLIGRLKTCPAAGDAEQHVEFQSLIGRLKTSWFRENRRIGGCFNPS